MLSPMPSAPWLRFAAIIVLGWIAHYFALQADFYLDDDMHIVNERVVHEGTWTEKTWRWIPYILWSGVFKLFGTAAPAYHALTLALHLTIACLVYPIGRQLLSAGKVFASDEDRNFAAWLGALIFVCHPLTTEPVHYARCLMIDFVALFTLLTVWRALIFAQQPGFRNAGWLALVMILGVCSKQPGVGHVTLSAAIVILAFGNLRGWMRQLKPDSPRRIAILAAVVVCLIAVLAPWIIRGSKALEKPFLFEHALTQARVFWGYAQRVVLPTNLSVDHYVPLTLSWRDPLAIVSSIALAALVGVSIRLLCSRRWKLAGVLICLALAQLLIRFGYVVAELMVEYRLYPAMPWIGLGAACGLVWLMRKQRIAGLAAMALVIGSFTTISVQRSHLWTDIRLLAGDAVEQYPKNLRAHGSVQMAAVLKEDFERVHELEKAGEAAFEATLAYNRENKNRAFELSRFHHWNAIYLTYNAVARRHLFGLDAGADYARSKLEEMRERFPDKYTDERGGVANPLVILTNLFEQQRLSAR